MKGRKLGVVAEGDEDQEDDFQDDGAESAGSWEEIDVDAYAEAVGHEEGDEDLEWDDPDEEYPLEQEEVQHGPAEAEQAADEEAEEYRDGEEQDYDEEEEGVEVPLQRATLHVSSDFPEADFDEASTFPSGVSVRAGRLRINAFRLRASGSQYEREDLCLSDSQSDWEEDEVWGPRALPKPKAPPGGRMYCCGSSHDTLCLRKTKA